MKVLDISDLIDRLRRRNVSPEELIDRTIRNLYYIENRFRASVTLIVETVCAQQLHMRSCYMILDSKCNCPEFTYCIKLNY